MINIMAVNKEIQDTLLASMMATSMAYKIVRICFHRGHNKLFLNGQPTFFSCYCYLLVIQFVSWVFPCVISAFQYLLRDI